MCRKETDHSPTLTLQHKLNNIVISVTTISSSSSGGTNRVLFKLAVTVHQCLNGRAPPQLSEHCIPVSSADMRRHLRSANRHLLAVPRFRLNTYGRRVYSVVGPMAWTLLPDFFYPGSNEQHRLF